MTVRDRPFRASDYPEIAGKQRIGYYYEPDNSIRGGYLDSPLAEGAKEVLVNIKPFKREGATEYEFEEQIRISTDIIAFF